MSRDPRRTGYIGAERAATGERDDVLRRWSERDWAAYRRRLADQDAYMDASIEALRRRLADGAA